VIEPFLPAPQGRVRALGVVVCGPCGDHDTRVSEVAEHGLVEQLVAHERAEERRYPT